MSESAFDVLQQRVGTGQLQIVHLVAPPRSSSTALERALSLSPDVDAQINDPWSIYNENREAQTYAYILGRVDELPAKDSQPVSVVIKDIADYIPPGEAWDRMTRLARHTIFLVRQPLLCLESMMRIMAREVPADEGEAYAHEFGYESWSKMQQTVNERRDYRSYDALYRELFRKDQPIHELAEMQVPVLVVSPQRLIMKLGFETHDTYAQAKGLASWNDLCQRLVAGDREVLGSCKDLVDENFRSRITGWTALGQHIDRMGDDQSYDIVDATIFRAMPLAVLPDVFRSANLSFSAEVVDWKASDKRFEPDYDGDVPYYDKVIESIGIAPPNETSIDPDRLPEFIQETLYGEEGVLGMYERLLGRVLSRLPAERKDELRHMEFDGKPLSQIDPIFTKLIK